MAASYKKTNIKSYPRVGEKITTDTLYWKNFEFPLTRKEHGGITNIDFSPVAPYDFAITNSAKVQIFSSETNAVKRALTRFSEIAYCGSYRNDGKLLVAGSGEGEVRVFDAGSKSSLRYFKGHSRPVHVTKFASDNLRVFSGSDDKTVRLWDIAVETELSKYTEHTDYIRCGAPSQASKDLFITGSYDHTVRLFDSRTPTSVLSVQHGAPVESCLFFPTGGIFISAGGNNIKVWDALAGGKLLTSFSHHHKTVTCMCLASDNRRLLSGSLDRHVKIYDVTTYQVVHSLDYPSAILSVGCSADDKTLVVGMADGLLSIQHRKSEETSGEKTQHVPKQTKKASYRYTIRGKTYTPDKDDQIVEHKRKEQLSQYDKYFKKFEHTKALDAALDLRVRVQHPEVTVSVMQELIRRGGIQAAMAGREEKGLTIIIKFIQKNLSNPRYTSVLLDVSTILIDLYVDQLGDSQALAAQLQQLKVTVDEETAYMGELLEVMGTMETLLATSEHVTIPQPITSEKTTTHVVPAAGAS